MKAVRSLNFVTLLRELLLIYIKGTWYVGHDTYIL